MVARDKLVSDVERYIRMLKERCRAKFNMLTFKKLPARVMVELVYTMNFWIHAFPAFDGVSDKISPRELVTGVKLYARRHCVVLFGTYVQTHEQNDKTMM